MWIGQVINNGVKIVNIDTDSAECEANGWIIEGALQSRGIDADRLMVVDGVVKLKPQDQIRWEHLPEQYKREPREGETSTESWMNGLVEITEREKQWFALPPKYKRPANEGETSDWYQSGLVEMTPEEKIEADELELDLIERTRQLSKSLTLKTVENQFLELCQTLTGEKVKKGFDELRTAINIMMETSETPAIKLGLMLLAIDAEGKREGGLQWWDDCVWHEDIV